METLHKKIIEELDEMIARAPDIDIEYEYRLFRQTHEKLLQDPNLSITGLTPRLLFVMDLIRFQMAFMMGGDVSESLEHILSFARRANREDVIKSFSDETRMQQMAKILENRGLTTFCERSNRSKSPEQRP